MSPNLNEDFFVLFPVTTFIRYLLTLLILLSYILMTSDGLLEVYSVAMHISEIHFVFCFFVVYSGCRLYF